MSKGFSLSNRGSNLFTAANYDFYNITSSLALWTGTFSLWEERTAREGSLLLWAVTGIITRDTAWPLTPRPTPCGLISSSVQLQPPSGQQLALVSLKHCFQPPHRYTKVNYWIYLSRLLPHSVSYKWVTKSNWYFRGLKKLDFTYEMQKNMWDRRCHCIPLCKIKYPTIAP